MQENRPIPNPELKVVFKMPWDKVLCRIAAAAVTVAVTEEATAAAAVTATTAKTAAPVPPAGEQAHQ